MIVTDAPGAICALESVTVVTCPCSARLASVPGAAHRPSATSIADTTSRLTMMDPDDSTRMARTLPGRASAPLYYLAQDGGQTAQRAG